MSRRSKLRWLCRRGSLELDLILTRFLDHRYEASSASEQRLFETLLGFPDPELQRLLIGGEDPNDSDLLKLVRSIRSAARNIA